MTYLNVATYGFKEDFYIYALSNGPLLWYLSDLHRVMVHDFKHVLSFIIIVALCLISYGVSASDFEQFTAFLNLFVTFYLLLISQLLFSYMLWEAGGLFSYMFCWRHFVLFSFLLTLNSSSIILPFLFCP